MIQPEERPLRQDGYMLEAFEDELLLYHLDQTRTIYLNNSAALVWNLCGGNNTVADIVSFLKEEYPEAAAQIEEDVPATLTRLRDAGAITTGS